jgi:adenylyltransferase/sulfurtransferase
MKMRFRELTLRKDPECPVCGTNPTVTALIDYDQFCGIVPAQAAPPAPVLTDAMADVSVLEFKAMLDAGTAPLLIDVREPHEYDICRIEGSVLIPLGDLPARVGELDPTVELVMQCRSGVRSGKAAAFLRERGFRSVHNLTGGILAWIDQVDPSQPKY